MKSIDISSIKAILVDVDQTLLDFDAGAREALMTAFTQHGYRWDEAYFAVFLRENALLWDAIEEGRLTRDQLRKIRFPIIFEKFGLPLEDPDGFEACFSDNLHQSHIPMKGAMEALRSFAANHIPVYAATNGPLEGQTRRLHLAGMLEYMNDVLASGQLGCAKPARRFFEQARTIVSDDLKESIEPEQIVLIGDSYKADIVGALAFGCRCVWLRENRQHDPFSAAGDDRVLEARSWPEVLRCFETETEDVPR